MPLTNEQFARIEREYQKRRDAGRSEEERRRQEVFAGIPAYAALDRRRLELTMDMARTRLGGQREGIREKQAELDSLRERKAALLTEAGYPADYLDPVYACPICRDTGFADGEKCRCFRRLSMELFHHSSGLWSAGADETFDSFNLRCFGDEPLEELGGRSARDNMRRHLKTAREYTEHFGEKKGNLLLTGPVGTGKTFLCSCIASSLSDLGYAIMYMTASEYFDMLNRLQFGEQEGSFEETQASADLLILGDLGMELDTRPVQTHLFRTVNERILKGQATIISTNLSMNQIREQYSERVASRLMGNYQVLRFAGGDLRFRRQKP